MRPLLGSFHISNNFMNMCSWNPSRDVEHVLVQKTETDLVVMSRCPPVQGHESD